MPKITITWKDSIQREEDTYTDVRYRRHVIKRYGHGWIVEGLSDDVFECHYCAENYIDSVLGKPEKESKKRINHGVKVIGKKKGAV